MPAAVCQAEQQRWGWHQEPLKAGVLLVLLEERCVRYFRKPLPQSPKRSEEFKVFEIFRWRGTVTGVPKISKTYSNCKDQSRERDRDEKERERESRGADASRTSVALLCPLPRDYRSPKSPSPAMRYRVLSEDNFNYKDRPVGISADISRYRLSDTQQECKEYLNHRGT